MMDGQSLGLLVDQLGPALVLYARQFGSAPEDVVQEAFLKLASQHSHPENVAAWLYRVVRNEAISQARSAQRRRAHETRLAQERPAWFLPAETPTIEPLTVTLALESLPIEEREIIVLHLWSGLSFADIALVTAISSSSAHRRYLTGLARLRERMNAPCPNDPKTN